MTTIAAATDVRAGSVSARTVRKNSTPVWARTRTDSPFWWRYPDTSALGAAETPARDTLSLSTTPGQAAFVRAEMFWSTPTARTTAYPGDTLDNEFVYHPHFSGSVSDQYQWLVAWQIMGRMTNGSWPGPAVALVADKGKWKIGGGASHPDGSKLDYAGYLDFMDDAPARWRIRVRLSADPAVGRVDAWLNGQRVVTDYHPPAGTLYPGQPNVWVKAGIYFGMQDYRPLVEVARSAVVTWHRGWIERADGSVWTSSIPGMTI